MPQRDRGLLDLPKRQSTRALLRSLVSESPAVVLVRRGSKWVQQGSRHCTIPAGALGMLPSHVPLAGGPAGWRAPCDHTWARNARFITMRPASIVLCWVGVPPSDL